MGKMFVWLGCLMGCAMLANCGCTKQDTERLTRVGKVAATKIEHLAGTHDGALLDGLHLMRGNVSEAAIDARISARIRWDKLLADAHIEVRAQGALVELKGTVRDLEARRRAVDLAESTLGVETVTDLLEVPTHEP